MNNPFRALSRIILVAAVFAAAGWYLYAPALRGPFVYDDIDNIVNNPGIRVTSITPRNLAGVMKSLSGSRPLAYASFALNYYVGRYDVAGYRLVNLAIHVFSALLVFLIARMTPPRPEGSREAGTAFLAAALWLVNPVHTQSVTYIVQRMNALSAMFVLLALYGYIRARQMQEEGRTGLRPTLLLTGTGLAWLCGLASKETAAILPVLLLLYECFFFRDLSNAWIKRQLGWMGGAVLALAVVVLVLTAGHPLEKLTGMYAKMDFTPTQRLLTQPRVVLYYLTLLLFPHPARLNLDYAFPLSCSPVTPAATLPAILALLALAAVVVVAAGKHRLYAFAVLWFLAALAVESSFLGLALIFEHRTYLPSVFPAIAAAHLLTRRIRPAPAGVLAAGLLMAVCGYGTLQRNRIWADPLIFWQDCVRKSPDKPIPCNNLGLAYKEAGGLDNALFFLNKALTIRKTRLGEKHPDVAESLSNIGLVYYRQGNYDRALAYHREALIILQSVFGDRDKHLFETYNNIGLAYDGKGDVDAALYNYQRALAMERTGSDAETLDTASIYNNLGGVWNSKGEYDKALGEFQKALAIRIKFLGDRHPQIAESFNNIGLAYGGRGDYETALGYYRQALDIELEALGENHPMTAATYFNLGLVSYARGDYPQAVFYMRRVVDLYTDALGRHHPYLETAASILNEAQRKSRNQNAGRPLEP